MNETLGKRIAALRRDKELKQDELAEKLGVTPQAVSKWENDQTCPDISLLPFLAGALGISVDELLTGKKEEAPAVRLLPESERRDINDMILRVIVDGKDGDKVRVNLPLALVRVALEAELSMPQMYGGEALKNIDLAAVLELVDRGAIGNIVEVESSDGSTVRVFVE